MTDSFSPAPYGLDEATAILADCNKRLMAWIEKSKTLDVPALLRQYWMMDSKFEALNNERKVMHELLEKISRGTVPEVFEDTGVKTLTLDDIRRRFTVSSRFSCSMIKPDEGKEWLRAEGHGALITETVNSGTLAAFAKSQMQEFGKELPPELFKLSTMNYTSITKV